MTRPIAEAPAPYFDALFSATDDPWAYRARWYEARKRALTLAALPQPRYASVYEPGCAIGELSIELAARCDRLLAADGNARAVELAQQRLARCAHARVVQAWLPDDWPAGERFDLIVISEFAYYLAPEQLGRIAALARSALCSGGTVVACHWRAPIDGCTLDGDSVHAVLQARLALPLASTLHEADFNLDVWCDDPRSVAEREGLR
jgi:SAM-dependent methyltransferase